jgi:hypothetical protein
MMGLNCLQKVVKLAFVIEIDTYRPMIYLIIDSTNEREMKAW